MADANRQNVPGSEVELKINSGITIQAINNKLLVIGHINAATVPTETDGVTPLNAYQIYSMPKFFNPKSAMDWMLARGFDLGVAGATPAQQQQFYGSGGLIPQGADEIVKGIYHCLASSLDAAAADRPKIFFTFLNNADVNHGSVFANAAKYYFRAIISPYEMAVNADLGTAGTYSDFFNHIENENSITSSASGRMFTLGVFGNISTDSSTASAVSPGGLPNAFIADKLHYLAVHYAYDNAVEGTVIGNKPYLYEHTTLDVCCAATHRILSQKIPYKGMRGQMLSSLMLPSDAYTLPSTTQGGEADLIMNKGWLPICYKEATHQPQFINTPVTAIYYPNTTIEMGRYYNVLDWLKYCFIAENLWANIDPLCGVELMDTETLLTIKKDKVPGVLLAAKDLKLVVGADEALADCDVQLDTIDTQKLNVYLPVSLAEIMMRVHSTIDVNPKYMTMVFKKSTF